VTLPALFAATYAVGFRIVTPLVAGVLTLLALWSTVQGIRTDLATTRRVVRESLPLLCVAGAVDIGAGLVLEARLDDFVAYPALLVLIPPFLADAGALGAILASRLASKLHLGALDPRGRPQGAALLDTTIIFLFALWLFTLVGVSADLVARAFGLATPGHLRMIAVSLVAGFVATLAVVVVAYYAAVASFRIGFDPDNHGVPVITSSMDLVGVISLIGAIVLLGLS
jgi:mgtE-like transporter